MVAQVEEEDVSKLMASIGGAEVEHAGLATTTEGGRTRTEGIPDGIDRVGDGGGRALLTGANGKEKQS